MHIRSRPLLGAALIAGLVAALTGCVPTADPVAEPTSPAGTAPTTAAPAVTPSPSETAAPSAADASALLIGPTSFSLVDDSGTELGTWEYRDGTGAVAALTEAFGSAPTESDDVPYEGYRSRVSSWPGFALKDTEVYDAGGPESTYPEPDFLVDASAASVGDVAITTLAGVAVGDAAADVAAEHPESVSEGSLAYFRFDETPIGSVEGTELVNGVGVIAEDQVTVSSIRAPYMNWGV